MTVSSKINLIINRMKKMSLRGIAVILTAWGLFSSCSIWENQLGLDLLPPGDKVLLFDTIVFDIDAYSVSGYPVLTSDISQLQSTLYLLGSLKDTIVGTSEASVFTQFTKGPMVQGPNTVIDTILLHLYIPSYLGNKDGLFTIRVYEATERIYKDSLYYSDYDMEGKYNPTVLGEKTFIPDETDTIEILLQDPDFIQRFLDVAEDSSVFKYDSIFKDHFNGLYLTASSSNADGAMANIALSDPVSRLTMRYSNDSTRADTTDGKDYTWATFPIDEYFAQKINMFKHDHSGTYLSGIIDNDSVETPYCYVQGMAGVNTRLSFSNLKEWTEGGKVAINYASLIFDVVPEKKGGIPTGELPAQLMLYSEPKENWMEYVYDYAVLKDVDPSLFGGELETVSKGMFFDTTYCYRFNMNLHFQSLVDGTDATNNFRLRVNNTKVNPQITKLWSNLSDNPSRIRLEVIYLKL
jgi:hypothetical protein